MKNWIFTLIIAFLCLTKMSANEFRAGHISITQLSASSVEANVHLVIDVHSDILDLTLCWGDGSCDEFPALSAQSNATLGVKTYTFPVLHSYAMMDNYTVSIEKCCFDNDVSNITSPANHNFVIETNFTMLNDLNTTPDYNNLVGANTAFEVVGMEGWVDDPEGDSYNSELCAIDAPGYMQPGEITPLPSNNFIYGAGNGDVIWNTPPIEGIYLAQSCTSEQRNGIEISLSKRIVCLIVGEFSTVVEELELGDWAIFPNPIQDKIIQLHHTGALQSEAIQVQIFNTQQQLIYSQAYNHPIQQQSINLSSAAAGLYYVLLRTDEEVYYEQVLLSE